MARPFDMGPLAPDARVVRGFSWGWLGLMAICACGNDSGDDVVPLPTGGCREDGDCAAAERCLRPGTVSPCMGTDCPPADCSADFDCQNNGSSDVCTTVGGVRRCVNSCAEAPCEAHESCGSDGRCTSRACVSAADCPADFGCPVDACVRSACVDDSVCSGFCVKGECYAAAGQCE